MGKPSAPQITPEVQETLKKAGELSERSRLLEQRMKQTRDKMQVLDETFSNKIKDLRDVASNLEEQIISVRKDIDETREILRKIVKDLESAAKMSDVRVLEKYINMIDISRLVTRDDIEEVVERIIKKGKN